MSSVHILVLITSNSEKVIMFPLDERLIDDEVVTSVINLTMRLANLQESDEFCQDLHDYLDSWEGYTRIRDGLERFFMDNRNLEKIIHQEASRIYIDYCYNLALKRYSSRIGG